MAGYYDSFQDARDQALNNWIRNFVLPYGSAYSTAHSSYLKTLDLQKKADEAERQMYMQLAMFALSFGGGSILTSVFGSAALKTAAANITVDVICKNEWEKAFKVAGFVADNKTAQFAIGHIWDEAGSVLSGKLKASLNETTSNFPALGDFLQKPLNLQNHLEMWVRDAYDRALKAGREIQENSQMNDGLKIARLTTLKLSPFFISAPTARIDETNTAINIELSFFMKYVMDLDYLAKGHWQDRGRSFHKKVTSRSSIDVNPLNKDYPKYSQSGGLTFQEVGYRQVGDIVKKRIDELNVKVFKEKFFQQVDTWGGLSEDYEDISAAVIRRAYTNLSGLGNRNRNLITLKSIAKQN